ncbi:MAG: glycoside hydrolase family 2 TIM barrel-domain containing protein [Henriciella sp.]|nr:glycoside hydrolase family 2 TIM barrel-domain containing protein [Henriciella sp.]
MKLSILIRRFTGRVLALLGMMMAVILPVASAEGLLLTEGRKATPLNGPWSYIVDPQDVGATNINGAPVPNGFFLDEPIEPATRLKEYSFDEAPTLNVPGSWTAQDETLLFYEGIVWLRRKFEMPEEIEDGKRFHLQFGAVNYHSQVYLNGQLVGENEGGFTPFDFDVTEALVAGENSLVLRVDSRPGADTLPAERFDWWNYGGITREVHLVETPETFIRNFRLQLDKAEPDMATGWVDLDGAPEGTEITVRIDRGRKVTATADANGRAAIRLEAPNERWSPEAPVLCKVEVQAGDDELVEMIGFRTIETRGNQILLNGEPVFLRGISLHEERMDGTDRSATEADARAIFETIKAMNGNYARLAHYPHNRHMARVADEMGILLWEEIPVYWAVDFEDPAVLDKANRMLSRLIARDGNRASVIIWSVANETPVSDARTAFLTGMVEHVRAEDPTRLVSAAAISTRESLEFYAGVVVAALQGRLETLSEDQRTGVVDDPANHLFDIVAYNEYLGWYDAALLAPLLNVDETTLRQVILNLIPQMRFKSANGKPLVISEFGAGAVRGREGGELDLWTEAYQAAVYRAQLQMIENSPGVAGISPWMLKDIRSPRRPMAGVQDYYNRKGVVDETGQPKEAYGVLADYYENGRRE